MTKEEIENKQMMAEMNEAFEQAMIAINEANAAFKEFSKTMKRYLGK